MTIRKHEVRLSKKNDLKNADRSCTKMKNKEKKKSTALHVSMHTLEQSTQQRRSNESHFLRWFTTNFDALKIKVRTINKILDSQK